MVDDGFIRLVGPFYQKGEGTSLRFRFPTADKHRNRRGVLQGGALMTFTDRVLGTAARAGRQTELTATMHMDMHFLDVVEIGEIVESFLEEAPTTEKSIFVRADLMVGTRVVAMAAGIWKRLGQRAPNLTVS